MRNKRFFSFLLSVTMFLSTLTGLTVSVNAEDEQTETTERYNVVFGQTNKDTNGNVNGILPQTEFTADKVTLEEAKGTGEYKIEGSCLMGNQANGRIYKFDRPADSGVVKFHADISANHVSTDKYTFKILAQVTESDGTQNNSYPIVSKNLNSSLTKDLNKGDTDILELFDGKDRTKINEQVYGPRMAPVYDYDIEIDLDKQEITYNVYYLSDDTKYSLSTNTLKMPEGSRIDKITSLEIPRNGSGYDCWFDNVSFYSVSNIPGKLVVSEHFDNNTNTSNCIYPSPTELNDNAMRIGSNAYSANIDTSNIFLDNDDVVTIYFKMRYISLTKKNVYIRVNDIDDRTLMLFSGTPYSGDYNQDVILGTKSESKVESERNLMKWDDVFRDTNNLDTMTDNKCTIYKVTIDKKLNTIELNSYNKNNGDEKIYSANLPDDVNGIKSFDFGSNYDNESRFCYIDDIDIYSTAQKSEYSNSSTQAPIPSNTARKMENINRGTFAALKGDGVYISWRLLGNESLSDAEFDIYKNEKRLTTTTGHKATSYYDNEGSKEDSYTVVKAGENPLNEKSVKPWENKYSSNNNSGAYMDIPLVVPADATPEPLAASAKTPAPDDEGVTPPPTEKPTATPEIGSTPLPTVDPNAAPKYTANDASVGDVDGDGEYEIILKWDPNNSKDNSNDGLTSNVYIDAYKLDGTRLWRINLGRNIRAGAHYTQFMVYDLDCDGKAEVIMKTAPGTIDGENNFVTKVGNTEAIKNADNSADYRNTAGKVMGGEEYLTIFNGETGAAMQTIDYSPKFGEATWGDTYGNRSERYLACVAYLDGEKPSVVFTRGYYDTAFAAAYDWDGNNLTRRWMNCSQNPNKYKVITLQEDGTYKTEYFFDQASIYGQGNHNLSVCDADNDGRDEIVFGSAVIDDDGRVLNSTGHKHGDAIHVSDFDNDGKQEVFQVHEDDLDYGEEYRKASTGEIIYSHVTSSDNGRGMMDNLDDRYTSVNKGQLAMGLSSGVSGSTFIDGVQTDKRPADNTATPYNSCMYWDGMLDRELLDRNLLIKADYTNGGSSRFYYTDSNGYTFSGGNTNNSTKQNACLTADIYGDWREEGIFRIGSDENQKLRVFVSTMDTEFRLYTLMHDSQYRCGVAWQNVGYNQPPHTSYYIGSAALAKDSEGNNLNYLAPATAYTVIEPINAENTANVVFNGIEDKNITVSESTDSSGNKVYNSSFPTTVYSNGNTLNGTDINVYLNNKQAEKSDSFNNLVLNGGNFVFDTIITGIPEKDKTSELPINMKVEINNVSAENNFKVKDLFPIAINE